MPLILERSPFLPQIEQGIWMLYLLFPFTFHVYPLPFASWFAHQELEIYRLLYLGCYSLSSAWIYQR